MKELRWHGTLLLVSYIVIIFTLFMKSYFIIYWEICRYLSIFSSFALLYVCGYFSTVLLSYEQNSTLFGVDTTSRQLFILTIILASGLTITSLFTLLCMVFWSYFSSTQFLIFLVIISIVNSIIIISRKNRITLFSLENHLEMSSKNEKNIECLVISSILGITVTIWILCGTKNILPFNPNFLLIFQMIAFFILAMIALYSIKKEKKNTTIISIFLILLLTRLSFYQNNNFILGNDSMTHYNRYLQIVKDPKLLFSLSPLNLFAPLTYSWIIFVSNYGSDYIIPFSFIIVSCFAYISIYTLGLKLSSFRIASIGILFSALEFTTFQFGYDIRTFTIALMYISLWSYSTFSFKENKKTNLSHLLLVILIGLSHLTSFFIILMIEWCLSVFYFSEKLLNFLNKGFISSLKLPFISKFLSLLTPLILIIFIKITEVNGSFRWLLDVLLNKNPDYYISLDLSRIPGLTSEIYGVIGMMIIMISRLSLLLKWFIAFIWHPKESCKIRDSIDIVSKKPLIRLLLYIFLSLCLLFSISLSIPNIVTPSRIFVFLIIPIGFILGFSDKRINKNNRIYTEMVFFLFLLSNIVRLNYFLSNIILVE